jgi:hypothetical protein
MASAETRYTNTPRGVPSYLFSCLHPLTEVRAPTRDTDFITVSEPRSPSQGFAQITPTVVARREGRTRVKL